VVERSHDMSALFRITAGERISSPRFFPGFAHSLQTNAELLTSKQTEAISFQSCNSSQFIITGFQLNSIFMDLL
jgi:hypothetical protein